ncbi:MAG: NAD-glutamate dehydrogenase, partial [Gammaproteobacteria bacterium]|nr:NAD-glutamate dehydrogenase [Gammaproteobacteria bacterium]
MQKKTSFLVALLDALRARLPVDDHSLAATFSRQFWSRVPDEDLADWEPADAASVTIAALKHFRVRAVDAVDIDVQNPEFERDGWTSSHTVVLIAHADMPFITDSVLMELSRHGLVTHHLQNVVFHGVRDGSGRLVRIDREAPEASAEVLIYAEIDRLEDDRLEPLAGRLAEILSDVRAVVGDFGAMKGKLGELVEALRDAPPPLPPDEVEEGIAFLEWLGKNRLTFLGYREFDYSDGSIR